MIRALCLNPVIDRIYYIDSFRAGTKYYEVAPKIYAGGKGVNIARILSLLGEPCVLYAFVGGEGGRLIGAEMAELGVDFRAFPAPGEIRTTVNIIDNQNRRETEVTEPGARVGRREQEQFMAALGGDLAPGDIVVCTGIPLGGMDTDIYRQISLLCEERGCRCVLDATGVYLRDSLPGRYFFAKPNDAELAELFGLKKGEPPEALRAWGGRMREMGIENLMISRGGEGCLFFREDGAFRAAVPRVPVVSTIGSGDSTVAGFCLGVSRGMAPEDCVRLAMACGACNAQHSKVGYVVPEQVQALFREITVTAL